MLNLILGFSLVLSTNLSLITPSIPKEKVAIVMVNQPYTEKEIKRLLAPLPDVHLRYIFKEALAGFSVEGNPESIEKLAANKELISITPVKKYQVETEENVKIIGGEEARMFLDEKNKRLTGEGITVGVIDTGVDYTHPDLRRSFKGGMDFIDGDKDPMETRSRTKATIHGTHVAGIIAGNGRIQGVAPKAKIIAYRALGPGGAGTTEQVLEAIEQSIKDRVDIVNLSLGNDVNGPDLPISMAINRAVERGIIAVVAAGNAGPDIWTIGSPGTATKAISVGASTPTLKVPFLIIEENGEKMRINPMINSEKWEFNQSIEVVDSGMGKKEDLKNIRGKIALIKRGGSTFTEKARNALSAGARGVLISNNINGGFTGTLENSFPIPVGSISKEEGERLRKRTSIIAHFSKMEEKDQLADFSSRGPVTGSWEIKPDVLAPGVAIHSSIPGGYLSLQGTSMAAPHVAGACALIKQAHPNWTPAEVKAAIMNTAKPLLKNETSLYRTYEQGAGRIQVNKAVHANTLVIPSSIRFGKFQTTDQNDQHKVILKIKNTSLKKLRYSFQIPQKTEGLRWTLPSTFTLLPAHEREIEVELSVDPSYFKRKIQDGYLKLNAGNDEIQLPFMYVLEEPDYPRVMGFDIGEGDKPGSYRYEVYLPGGAEEFGIALFRKEDYRFVGFLDYGRNLGKGQHSQEIDAESLPENGVYFAKIFAKRANREDSIETVITVKKVK